LLEHLLLVGLGLQVEEADRAIRLVAEGLAAERDASACDAPGCPGHSVELAVFPERLEVRDGPLEQIGLAALVSLTVHSNPPIKAAPDRLALPT
jgi:hypothetical protein